jgi:hypothetical protein
MGMNSLVYGFVDDDGDFVAMGSGFQDGRPEDDEAGQTGEEDDSFHGILLREGWNHLPLRMGSPHGFRSPHWI